MKVLTKNLIMSNLNLLDYIKLRKFLSNKEIKEKLSLEDENNIFADFLSLKSKNNCDTFCIVVREKNTLKTIGIIFAFCVKGCISLNISLALKEEFTSNKEYIKEMISTFSEKMLNKYTQLLFNVSAADSSIQEFFNSLNLPRKITIADKVSYFYIVTKDN